MGFASRKDKFNLQLKHDMAKQYKHIKSNSEAMTNRGKNFEESRNDSSEQVYANRKTLKIDNYSPDKQIIGFATREDSSDQNMVILKNDFTVKPFFEDYRNTAKYSQSPFLNKLTNLKQKLTSKNKVRNDVNQAKGHKSRNSMFPKSYTENALFPRREPEIFSKIKLDIGSVQRIPEEPFSRHAEETKNSNPYSNIEVENEIVSAYGNEPQSVKGNLIFQDNDKNKFKVESYKKRNPTDTTRSKTGIDASNESGKAVSQHKSDFNVSKHNNIPVSAEKKIISHKPQNNYRKQPSDYYQFDKNQNDQMRKGEIISILSMEIGESEGLSQSYSHKSDHGNDPYKLDSKKNLRKVLGLDQFENQKTLKQNIQYLKNQFDVDPDCLLPAPDNLKVVDCRPIESRHLKHRKVEYRERLEEEKGYHKKAKSHRNNKYQYIRNNHDIISKHQRHKSSDSTENSILKRSNGFEILYKKGEKLAKMLNHYDSVECSHNSSSYTENQYSVKSASNNDESSSISEIGKIKVADSLREQQSARDQLQS